METFQSSNGLTIPLPAGQSLTPIEYIGAGANGFVLKVSNESNICSALKIVPIIAKPNEKKASGIDRENRFYQYLANAENIPNLARAIAWWSIDNVDKSVYFKWRKALRTRLNVKEQDRPSQLIKTEPDEFKVSVHFVHMEFYTSGNLRTWLKSNSDKCEETYLLRIELFSDILSAVDFLHERGLMHRDICPNNIFLAENDKGLYAILGDFDSIVSCGEQALWPLTKVRETFTSVMGTDPYAAPEIDSGDYDQRCDLFSLGVIALNMFFNILDYNRLRYALHKIQASNIFATCIIADKSTFWQDIVIAQLSSTPQRRMSSCELLRFVPKEKRTREKSLYLLNHYDNILIMLKDSRLGSGSLLSRLSRFGLSGHSSQSSWETLPPMPKPMRSNFSVATCAGKMYVIGHGYVDSSNTVQQFDTQTGWQDYSPMLEKRGWCGAAALSGRLFAVGGYDGTKRLSSAEECDLETGRWAHVAPMTTARSGVGVAALGNLLFAVGGNDYNLHLNSLHKSAEWYDPRAGRWTKAAPMHEPRSYLGCAALGDRLYVAGGRTDFQTLTASVEWFDLRAGRWTPVRDMGVLRESFVLAALNGQLLAVGGNTNRYKKKLDTVEVYDEKRDAWSTLDVRLPNNWGPCAGCVVEY